MTKPTEHQTADSYDAHIIPADIATRKEREGEHFKEVPNNSENPDSLDTTGGYTVDSEGLVNNYAVEPEMYVDKPGDLAEDASPTTIIDIFATQLDAEKAVLAMHEAGLTANKISIIGKDYHSNHDAGDSLTCENINKHGGLAVVLTRLGIAEDKTSLYTTAIDNDQFIVLVTGSDRDASQAQHVLQTLGHQEIAH
ncbi:MAG: hypothetical protein ACRC2J_09070 [Microcoleaceae cyanobacterium]